MSLLLLRDESVPLAKQIEEAYLHGCSDVEICRLMRITHEKFKNLYESNSDFRELIEVGRTMSQAYWMAEGRENISNNKFNTSLWMFNMKNRFGWAEKAENVNQEVAPQSIDDLRQKIDEMLPRVAGALYPGLSQSELMKVLGTKGGTA